MLFSDFALALAVLQVPGPQPPAQARAVALRVEHLVNPLGIDVARPRFSWQMADSRHGARQTGYSILVASTPERLTAARADVWNSDVATSSQSLDIEYAGATLAARHRYYWTVCIRDQNRRMAPCAAAAWFETGKLGEAWQASWIARSKAPLDTLAHDPADGDTTATDGRPPLLRRGFVLRAAPVRARIYIATLGGYRLTVNGAPAGPGVFTPDWTDYRYRVTYQTYDATRLLHAGPNAIGVLLGAGWYASRFGFSSKRYAYGPPPVRVLCELHVTYADGREEVISSDSTWRTAPSAVLISEIYDGETYDARLERLYWDRSAFNDRRWQHALALAPITAALQAQAMAPIEETGALRPVRRWSPAPGTYVFDLGQNIAGWARLRVRGRAGTRVRLRFAEILASDSNITQVNLRTAKATDTYIARGHGLESFEPHFTYHGFRYIEVTGFPGEPTADDVTGIVVGTALPRTGELSTSDPALNRLWQNVMWTQRANLFSVPTDCPQRDERMGWMGDAQVFWRTASYNMDMTAFGEKWLADVRDGQLENGCFPNFAPNFLGVLTCGAPGWADAGVIIPWTAWRQYGDTRVLAQQWSAMQRYMTFIRDSNPDYLWRRRKTTEFGDWLPAGSTKSFGETHTDLISTAFWAYDAQLMSQMARALGQDREAAEYHDLSDHIRTAFDSAFVHADGKVGAPFVNPDGVHSEFTQTGAVLALHFGLVPDSLRAAVVRELGDDITAHHGHLTTGFLGSAYILPVLSEGGRDDLAFQLLLTRTFPSWLYEVDQGATTTWERWNGDHGNPEMNSYSHYAFGAVGEWLYRYLGGIDQSADATGFDKIVIQPRWDTALDSVRAVYRSVRGAITSAWQRRHDGSVLVTVTIPANTTGEVRLPATSQPIASGGPTFRGMQDGRAVFDIDAGTYSFVVAR
ncbi:MAG TPA: family 78 glycoside hydrolase catalytic domain [Gemmatimonadales bacterium]|jgi:alpha-L-rhamnosidase